MDNSKKNSSDEELKIRCIELLIESNSIGQVSSLISDTQKLLDFIKKNDS